ncbi:MAG: hypothetical protein ACYC3X_11290 [Pirellulaceae bacterium]
MSRRNWVAVASLVAISFASVAAAAEGWSVSKLNPFKKSSPSKRAHANVSDEKSGIGLPHMSLPSLSSKSTAPKRKSEPSTLAKMNQSTKNFFGKTKDVLMPWSKSSKKPSASYGSNKKPAKKKSFLTSWMPEKKAEKKTQTMGDFLGGKRPESEF